MYAHRSDGSIGAGIALPVIRVWSFCGAIVGGAVHVGAAGLVGGVARTVVLSAVFFLAWNASLTDAANAPAEA
jgi:hypothetical protein